MFSASANFFVASHKEITECQNKRKRSSPSSSSSSSQTNPSSSPSPSSSTDPKTITSRYKRQKSQQHDNEPILSEVQLQRLATNKSLASVLQDTDLQDVIQTITNSPNQPRTLDMFLNNDRDFAIFISNMLACVYGTKEEV